MLSTIEKERRALHLRLAIERAGGVSDGVVAFSGRTTKELAEAIGLPRQTVQQCLNGAYGRTYPGVRRALETELGLPVYTLDELID